MRSFLICLVVVHLSSAIFGASLTPSWNSFLLADQIFPVHLDTLEVSKSGTFDRQGVTTELNQLLNDETVLSQIYENFLKTHQKVLPEPPPEVVRRESIFKANLLKIAKHNLDFAEGLVSYTNGVTVFADLTSEEFVSTYTGGYANPPESNMTASADPPANFEKAGVDCFDWRTNGTITPVKQQGGCLSCTLFSTASLVEAANARAYGVQLDLSEEELMNCGEGTECRRGNWYGPILDYVVRNGMASEADYRYDAKDHPCYAYGTPRAAGIKSYGGAPQDEETWKDVVVQKGPMGVIITTNEAFQHFKGSQVYEGTCNQGEGDHGLHAVNVIGFGTEGGRPYWIIKNSWGTSWGDNGFVKLPRGENKCSINKYIAAYIDQV